MFELVKLEDLNQEEINKAIESLIFLAEKRDRTVKGRTHANSSMQREHVPKEVVLSPVVTKESLLIAEVAEAKQRSNAMILDIPNAFAQIDIPEKDSKKIIMKIMGSLVDILLEIDEDKHEDFIICHSKEKLPNMKILKVLCSVLVASILCYEKFRKDIKVIGHEANPCNVSAANKIINGKEHTLT